jgi:hypothetical protein
MYLLQLLGHGGCLAEFHLFCHVEFIFFFVPDFEDLPKSTATEHLKLFVLALVSV